MTTIKIPNGGNIYFVCILIARILYILVAEHILHNVDNQWVCFEWNYFELSSYWMNANSNPWKLTEKPQQSFECIID